MRRYGVRALRAAVILGFARSRIVRHEEIGGVRCALIPFRSGAPDVVIARDTELTAQKLTQLRERYALVLHGLPLTHGAFFQIPDTVAATVAA